jgi:hypothetical protein
LEVLKATSEATAVNILRLLRSNGDVSAILSIAKGGMGSKQRPSIFEAARAPVPLTQSTLDFELMIKNPISYPYLQPVDISALQASDLVRSVNASRAMSDRAYVSA